MTLKTKRRGPQSGNVTEGRKLCDIKLLPRFTVWCQRSSCVVTGGIYWMLRMSQILRIAPLQFKRTSSVRTWRIRVSKTQSVINNIWVIICSVVIAFVSAGIYGVHKPGSIMRLTNITNVIMTALVVVFGAASRMKTVIQLLDRVNEIKTTLTKCYKIPATSETSKVLLFLFLIFFCYIYAVDFIHKIMVLYYISKYIIPMSILYYYVTLIGVMLTVQFAVVAHEVSSTFKLLNDCLLLLQKNILTGDSGNTDHPKSVQAIISLYNTLPDLIRQLDAAFGTGVTVHLVVGCLKIVYASVLLDTNKYPSPTLMSYWVWVDLVLFFFLMIMVTTEIFSKLYFEMNRTKRLVCQLLTTSPDAATTRELVKFSQCLLLREWKDSSLKLCVLSRNSIAQICGNIATYILMVINFNTVYKLPSTTETH